MRHEVAAAIAPPAALGTGSAVEQVEAVVETLESSYGRPTYAPRFEPLDELVACILSQHTSDVNSLRAFGALKAAFADWDAVRDADPGDIAAVIRGGGLADSKAARIKEVLQCLTSRYGSVTLDALRGMDDDAADAALQALPGVGPKTAAIVLCFAFGRPRIPVDTHVFRVSWRLGLIARSAGEGKAHSLLRSIVPEPLAFRFHVALIRHGREVCRAQRSLCHICPLTSVCREYAANPLLRERNVRASA